MRDYKGDLWVGERAQRQLKYLNYYRGSWTRMRLEAKLVDEIGDDGHGVGLVFEVSFDLTYTEVNSPVDPGLIIAVVSLALFFVQLLARTTP